MRLKRELLIGAAFLTAVIVLAYGNILFRGQTLVSTSNYSPIDDRFTHLRTGTMTGAGFLNWHDQGGVWWQWEPAAQFFGQHYRQGTVPMWDPTVAGGVDTHVNVTQSQYFLPHTLLLLSGNTPFQRDLYYLLLLLSSGLACFALLRRNGFHRISAVFMGAGFMLSGVMTQNINALLGQTFATLPMFLLAADVLLDRLTWRAWGGAALVIGLCTYSSFLPIVISGYVLIAIQALAYAVSRSPDKGGGALGIAARQIVMFGATVLTALALAAFFLIPLAAVQHANSAFHTWYTGIGQMHYSLDLLATLVSPRLFFDVYQTFPAAGAMIPKPQPWTTHFFYVGFLIVTLIPVARWDSRPRVRRLTLFFALASVLFFMKLMGVPPVQWIADLPVFEFLHFIPYFSGAFGLALVGLAACSVESVIQHDVGRRQFVAATAMAVIAMAGVAFLAIDYGTNPAATFGTRMRYAAEAVRVLAVVAALLLTLFFRRRGRIGGQAAGAIVVALLAIELVPIAYHRRYLRSDIWKDPPEYVQVLKQDRGLFRVHAMQDPALPPNTFQAFGISGISSLGVFNAQRYTGLINKYFETVANSSFILTRSLLPTHRPVLDLLNVKYVVTHNQSADQVRQLAAGGFEAAAQDGNFSVYKNTRVWPRAFVAHDYTTVPDATAAIAAIASLETRDRVILEYQPGFVPSVQPASACAIDSYEPNVIKLSGDSPGVGILVVLDSFSDGWSATLNGEPATIVAAYGAFRGVQVPRGRWQVTMTYRSPSARTGLTVSLSALVIALMALGIPRRKAGLPPLERVGATTPMTDRPKPSAPRSLAETLQLVYRQLYSEAELEEMRGVWTVLVRNFFQKRINPNGIVVDVGSGPCLFINEVRAARRIAIDANPDTLNRAAPGVEVMNAPGSSLADLPDGSVDHIFMSNFLEHLEDYREVIEILSMAFEKLKPGGSLLILQPNYRLFPKRYFDAIDHKVVLTDRNLVLVLRALSFSIDELKVRFLPFTGKSRIPKKPWLVKLYLRIPPLQWLMGGQTFINAGRPGRP